MSIMNYKTFDLDKARPKVLLLGNGLTYNAGVPWHTLIKKTARQGASVSQYEQLDANNKHRKFYVPNTVLMLAVSETGDKQRHKKYVDALEQKAYPPNENLQNLLAMPFDAVLTTNFTYELESELRRHYPGLSNESKRRYAYVIDGKRDGKYLLHTFNRIGKDTPDIWHIHGELRRPSSVILSHDEYARLVYSILAYNKRIGNAYEKHRNELKFLSWVDYLILGDVYILGLGMDFSEFDLWWLLGRRLREKTSCGKIIFYEPQKTDNNYNLLALRDAGVTIETCGISIQSSADYNIFYDKAIQSIKSHVTV